MQGRTLGETEIFEESNGAHFSTAKDGPQDPSIPVKYDPATKYHKDKNMVIGQLYQNIKAKKPRAKKRMISTD